MRTQEAAIVDHFTIVMDVEPFQQYDCTCHTFPQRKQHLELISLQNVINVVWGSYQNAIKPAPML